MAWTTPTSVATGAIITQTYTEQIIRDNLLYLKDREDNPTRCRAYHNTTQSLTSATDTALALNSEYNDTGTLHDNVTNNSRVTIPSGADGYYLVTTTVEFASNATGQRKIQIRYNGTDYLAGETVDAAAGGNATRLSAVWQGALSATNYVQIVATQNSGGALDVAQNPELAVVRLG